MSRLGRIIISNFDGMDREKITDIFYHLRFLPQRIQLADHVDSTEYMGESDDFADLKPGDKIPVYELTIRSVKGKIDCVHVEKSCQI